MATKEKEPKLKQARTPRAATQKPQEEERLGSTNTGTEDTQGEDRLEAPAQDLPAQETEGDYLRKYQYRKQTQPGSVASDPPAGSKAEKMKKFLLSQPRVRMLIPRGMGEDRTISQSVCLNGYRLDFPKDTYVEVPLQVADVLGESLNQTNAALMRDRIDGNKDREKALL